jgi:hypothetical protein
MEPEASKTAFVSSHNAIFNERNKALGVSDEEA